MIVRHFSSSGCWNTMPTSRAGSNGTFAEPMVTVPPSCGCRPARILSSVLLPQPDGPTSDTSSPGMTSKVAFEIARCVFAPLPYDLVTLARWMKGSVATAASMFVMAPAGPDGPRAWGGPLRSCPPKAACGCLLLLYFAAGAAPCPRPAHAGS